MHEIILKPLEWFSLALARISLSELRNFGDISLSDIAPFYLFIMVAHYLNRFNNNQPKLQKNVRNFCELQILSCRRFLLQLVPCLHHQDLYQYHVLPQRR